MKYGILFYKDTDNIGDDIQTFAALKYLPHIDYIVDREHLDTFVPNRTEKVAIIMNSWLMHKKYNWPPSPYLHPLFVSTHFTENDPRFNLGLSHLSGFGLDYLTNQGKIGCRDESTLSLLKDRRIDAYLSGCLTLTIDKFSNVEKGNYICAVDISDALLEKIKNKTDKEIRIVKHAVDAKNNSKLSFDERMQNVENLLKVYQGASVVVTTRLHCALPCLALGIPVIVVFYEYNRDRLGTFLNYFENCIEEEILNDECDYDFNNPKQNSDKYLEFRNSLIPTCNKFIDNAKSYDKKNIDLPDVDFYKRYVIKKTEFQKEILLNSYVELKSSTSHLQEQLREANERIQNQLSEANERIQELNNNVSLTNAQFESKNSELNNIYNSRVWRIGSKYYTLKKIFTKFYKKIKINDKKAKKTFKIIEVKKHKNKIEYVYEVSDDLQSYFYLEGPLSIEYSENIEMVPDGIAVIPLITNILPLIWLEDATIIVDEIDKKFFDSMVNIKEGYKGMFPWLSFKGKVKVNRKIKYSPKSKQKTATFFSGGVDSFSTLINVLDQKPHLITVWGADVNYYDDKAWAIVQKYINDLGVAYNLRSLIIKSSLRVFIDNTVLNDKYGDLIKDNWWHAIQHGIGMIGHAAPYAYKYGYELIYMPGTFTNKDTNVICASYPTIDNSIAFGCTSVFHEGFEKTRYEKVQSIVKYHQLTDNQTNLRVCYQSKTGDNCCKCEKCYRTITALMTLDQDPADYGFNVNDKTFKEMHKSIKIKNFLEDNVIEWWKEIQINFIKNKKKWSKDSRIKWLLEIDFDKLKH